MLWRLFLRIIGPVYTVCSTIADFMGGWTVFFGALSAGVTAVWAFLLNWGPLSVPLAAFTAATVMLAWDYGTSLWNRFQAASKKQIQIIRSLNLVTQQGRRFAEPQYTRIQATSATALDHVIENWSQRDFDDWKASALIVLMDSGYEEFYGFQSATGPAVCYNKIRRITMRLAKQYRVKPSDILADAESDVPLVVEAV